MPEDRIIRVVVTGDNHLGQRLSRLRPDRAARRREIVRESFAKTVTAAIERKADLFVQAGDLFDVQDPYNQDREFVAEQFRRLHEVGITACAVSGNHDMPRQSTEQGGAAPLGVYATLGAVRYFPNARVIRPFLFERNGLTMAIGALSNDPGRPVGEDPLAEASLDDPQGLMRRADVGFLIVHAAISGEESYPDSVFPISTSGARLGDSETIIHPASLARFAKDFQVIVTGHIHRYQRLRVGGVETVVCGPSEWMDFGDVNSGSPGYAWLEIGPGGLVRDEHALIPPQPRRTIDLTTEMIWPAGAEVAGATERIIERITSACQPDAQVRLRLAGEVTREQYRELDLRRILAWGQERCFAFEVLEQRLTWRNTLVVNGDDDIARGERVSPRDMLAEIADTQIATGTDLELWEATRAALLERFDALDTER